MREEINKYRKYSTKKKTDNSFSKKINFYKKPDELPAEITAEEYNKFISTKKKSGRLGKKKEGWHNGSRYDSRWEARYAAELDLKKKAGLIRDWQKQVTIELNVKVVNNAPVLTDERIIDLKKKNIPCHHICNYRIDFVVEDNEGNKEYVEVKGFRTELWIIKYRLFEILFGVVKPENKLIVIN